MQLKLKDMQNKYLSYVDEELNKLPNEEDRLSFLQDYLIEKQEIYKIYHNDLIEKTTDIDKLKEYLKHHITNLYRLFTQRDKAYD